MEDLVLERRNVNSGECVEGIPAGDKHTTELKVLLFVVVLMSEKKIILP